MLPTSFLEFSRRNVKGRQLELLATSLFSGFYFLYFCNNVPKMKFIITFTAICLFVSSLEANSYLYVPLEKIPKGKDILAFTNGPLPATGTRKKLTQEEVARFLDSGIPIRDPQKITYPTSWSDSGQSDGVFFDKEGKAYFWRIVMAGEMNIQTEDGARVRIQLIDGKK